jgi:peptidoglycan endopeptidase LytE
MADTNPPALENTNPPVVDTNPPVPTPPSQPTPQAQVQTPVVPPPAQPQVTVPMEPAGSTYEVVAGDTLAKIAKAHGVTVKALEAANPGVDPKKLKVKQKLVIPGATQSAENTSASPTINGGGASGGSETYVVKSGDTLTKIAKKHGVSLKALRAANNMNTDHIKVGDKLTIPVKAEAAAPAPETTAAPVVPPTVPASAPTSAPAPVTPAPAPGH